MFGRQQQRRQGRIPNDSPIRSRLLSRSLRVAAAIGIGVSILFAGLAVFAQSENVEVVVWDTGPSIQGDDGAIVSISGPVSHEFYAGPDEDQSNPHPLYVPAGDYSFTVTAVWPQQPDIDGTSDECSYHGRCDNYDIAKFYIDFRAYPTAPTAEDDHETTEEDTPVVVDVLDNDSASIQITLDGSEDSSVAFETETLRRTTGPDLCCGDLGYPESQAFNLSVEIDKTRLDVVWVGTSSHGSAAMDPDGTITYTPNADYCGTDQFEYTIEDSNGSDTATVFIEIECVSDPPIAEDDSAATDENTYVNIYVTANDSDPDGSIDASTVSIVRNPEIGEIDVDPASGVVTYTPDPGTCGSDSFSYRVNDFDGTPSNEAIVMIDVICNESPVAGDDFASTNENTSIGINILSNDWDSDGSINPESVTITTDPDLGELSVHPSTGAVTYTPDPGACGVDSFRYTVGDDDWAISNEATVTIDVMCDDPPLAIDDLYTVAEGQTLDVPDPGILSNDETNPEEPLSAILVSDVSHGTLQLNSDGSFVYTHDGSETTSDSFTYLANDRTDDSNVATVNIVVTPTNDGPTAEDDEDTTDEDTPVDIDILANDSDPDGDSLSVDWISTPLHGDVINNGSDITYVPDPDFHGVDTFTYGITDGHGGSATATVEITVAAVNDPPVAQNDSAGTDEDIPIDIDVMLNDSDPDGDGLSIQSVTQADNGAVTQDGSEVTYTPDPDFHGVDSFTYTIDDGNGGTSTATVTVTVAPVNDPPTARDDQADSDEDTPIAIDVLRNDGDPDGDSLSVEAVSQPANGSVINNGMDVVYTPDPDFNGVDTFTYGISDGNGGTATATVTVIVAPVNDPPVAQDDSAFTDEDVSIVIDLLANDNDSDGDMLTIESVTQPANGSVINNGTDVIYTPDPGSSGVDTFTYAVSDGNGGTAEATVAVAVATVNDAPVAQDDSDVTDEDIPVTIPVLVNDSDPDGDTLVVESVTQPANGSVSNNATDVTYTPDAGFNGLDIFIYVVSDGNGGTAEATVTVAVATVNDLPIAQDDSAFTNEDTPVVIGLLTNDDDPDGDALTIQSVTQPANGSVDNNGTDVTYTPEPGFNGADSFTYVISDGKGGTATATVAVTIAPVNDLPIALDDGVETDEGNPVTIPVLLNDSDPDGDVLVVESVTQPLNGGAVPSGASVVYTPSPGFAGTDTLTYTTADGNGGTATAIVTIIVVAANDPPAAQDDSATASEDTPLTIPVLANDSDPDADPLVVESIVKPAAHGFAINNGTDITYIPDPGFVGVDYFTYTAADGRGETDTARVTVVVSAVNDPPVAQDDAAVADEGTLVTIPVLANDSDPDGDFLLVESFSQPLNGSVLNSRTGVSYIPNPGFRGVDTFTYRVTDGNGGTATAKVTVSVGVDNESPVAQEDSDLTDEGIAVLISVLLNDSDPDGDPLIVESVSSAGNGRVLAVGTDIQYTPNAGFSGVDEFTYTVSDGRGGADTARVLVAVVPVNDSPVAQNDSSTVSKDTPITISVLANDTDPDGDSLIVESIGQPQNGTVDNNGTDIVYTPNAGFTGRDTFAYTVSDGRGSTDTATVTVGVSSRGGAGGAGAKVPCDGKVIISEVAWAGTAADSKDEWIELRNLGTAPVDLNGWVLRWRRTRPSTSDDQIWKVLELSGILAPAPIAECDRILQDTPPGLRIYKENPEDVLWFVSSEANEMAGEYYLLERRHDATVSDVEADLIYDTSQALSLELSDLGEVIMLVNDAGEVVDTANASYLGRDGWAAGSAATRGTMERIDPLGPDTAENWDTNTGIVIHGTDARSQLLRATPGAGNSPVLENLAAYAEIEPTTVRLGETLRVGFSLPRQDRRKSGWPWLNVTRPGFTGLVGAGGAADLTRYSFSGRYQSGDDYVLEIETANLTPGSYVFWIIYGQGKAILVPVVVTP